MVHGTGLSGGAPPAGAGLGQTLNSSALPTVGFGTADLQVTRLCQGTAFRTLSRDAADQQAEAVLGHCLDAGVRFFDSSNAYGWGGSERLLGQALKGRRDEVVICTKVSPTDPPPVDGSVARGQPFTEAYLTKQLDGSRQRLDTDVIDLYLLHAPDGVTPMEQLCERMQKLIDGGGVSHWGVSNHSAAQMTKLLAAAKNAGTSPPVGAEDYYTIAGAALTAGGQSRTRQLERELFPVLHPADLGLLAFSPMDGGDLAKLNAPAVDSPLAELLQVVDRVAAELSTSRGAICVAWVLAQKPVTAVLGGAESTAHVDEMVEGLQLTVPASLLAQLNTASYAYSQALEAPRK
jgi:aryl-alcohol dehydrogenase-like predicted oxidoreductase